MMQYNYLYDSMATRVVPDSWVVSQIWIDSDSNESSHSRVGRENQGYESRVSSRWSPFESELSELDTIESKLSHWLFWRETVKILHLSTALQSKNQPTVTIEPPPPPRSTTFGQIRYIVMSCKSYLTQLWLKWVSRSRVRLPNLEFELGRCRAKQEKWSVELSQSRITRIVAWVRVESARKIWVEHNPAGYQYYFPFTLFGIAQCSYLNGRFYCEPTSERNPAPLLRTVGLDTGHVASRFRSYTALSVPLPVSPHPPRPVPAGCPARIGSTEWPWSAGLDSAWVGRRSRSFTSLPPLPLPQRSYYNPWSDLPFLGRVHCAHTDRDRSATWCQGHIYSKHTVQLRIWLASASADACYCYRQ